MTAFTVKLHDLWHKQAEMGPCRPLVALGNEYKYLVQTKLN